MVQIAQNQAASSESADRHAHLDGGGDRHTYTYTYAHHPAVPNTAAVSIHDGYDYSDRIHDLDAFADLTAYRYAPHH
jgi:hypothetical protein